MDKLWQELQRRHVVRVGVVYVAMAWLLAQVADLALDNFNAPNWIIQSFLLMLVAGFPVALIIAWAFELTPQGLRREVAVSERAKAESQTSASSSGLPRYALWAVAAIGFATIIFLGTRFAEQQRSLADKEITPRVVVAVFENGTGNASLDSIGRLAADVISQGLQRTGIVEVVPPNKVLYLSRSIEGLGDMVNDPVTRLAQETGATHAIAGTYYLNGDAIQFHAHIIDTRSGVNNQQLIAIEPVSARNDRPGEAIEALRQRVMGAIASLIDPRIEQPAELMGHMPNYNAYRAFIEGLELFWRSDFTGSQQHFQHALELDPDYHLPRILLVFSHHQLREWTESELLINELEGKRDDLSVYESYRLDQLVAAADGDLETAYHAARQASSISPEFGPVFDSAAFAIGLNRPQEGVEVLQTIDTNRVLIGWTMYWDLLTVARHMLGDHDEELDDALVARAKYPDSPDIMFAETRARAALGDTDSIQKLINASIMLGPQPGWTAGGLMRMTGEELIAHGKVDAGQAILAKAVTWYQTLPPKEMERLRYSLALTLISAGRQGEAIPLLEILDQETPNQIFILGALGVAKALQGDRMEAEHISVELERMNLPYSFGSISAWQAQIAALQGNKDQAMIFLRRAASQGTRLDDWIHRQPAFKSLLNYPPFQALLKPTG